MLRPDFVPERGDSFGQRADVLSPSNQGNNFFAPGQPGGHQIQDQQHNFGIMMSNTVPQGHPGATGQRYYTIQRVNGNGGNGKGDGVAGPHKHTLAESDRVKKNSVQRFLMKKDKEEKKTQVSAGFLLVVLSSLLALSLQVSCAAAPLKVWPVRRISRGTRSNYISFSNENICHDSPN